MSLLDSLLLEAYRDPHEIYISLRADGQKGSGTIDDPYDGSTRLSKSFNVTLNQDSSDAANRTVLAMLDAGAVHDLTEADVVRISGLTGSGLAYAGDFVAFEVSASSFKYNVPVPFTSTPPANTNASSARVIYSLDEVLRNIGEFVRIHLGPGVFETRGFVPTTPAQALVQGWAIRKGQSITGAGIQATTLKLMFAHSSNQLTLAVSHDPNSPPWVSDADYFTASDFTVDCNLRSQLYDRIAKGAIVAKGSHVRIRRVRAIDFGTQTDPECFVIGTAGGDPYQNERVNCQIEDCIIEQPGLNSLYNNGCLVLLAGEQTDSGQMGFHRACALRNNYVNHEYCDDPVPVAGITVAAGVATVTTRVPHRRAQDQWVVLSGALVNGSPTNSFNGSYKITEIIGDPSASVSFKVTLTDWTGAGIPTSNPAGDLWVDRFTSHRVPVLKLERIDATTARMTTLRPHNRKPGQMVNVLARSSEGELPAGATPYLGRLPIAGEIEFSPTVLRYQTNGDPSVSPLQNPFVIFTGMTSWGLAASAGSAAVTEGNHIFGCTTGGTYTDTWGTRDFTDRSNYYSDVTTGPYQGMQLTSNLKPGSSLTYQNLGGRWIATFTTVLPHGFQLGQAVWIRDADPAFTGPFVGYFKVETVPLPTMFTFALSTAPSGNTLPGPLFAAIWQFGLHVIENNIIELTQPSPPGYDYGLPDAIGANAVSRAPQYTFRQAVVRDNLIRNLPTSPTGVFYGITFYGAENALVEGNVVDLPQTNPIFHNDTKSIRYFNNQEPSGKLIQGTASFGGPKVDDLATQIEGTLLLCL